MILRYWLQGEDTQNFGDFLSELFAARLFTAPKVQADVVRVVGSCLADWLVGDDLQGVGRPLDGVLAAWACGSRDGEPISQETWKHLAVFGVRGPLTRDALGLPADTALGDSGLLIPLLHAPKKSRLAGKTLCIPHFHDRSSDAELLERTGVEAVVRPGVANSLDALEALLDTIAGADFILSGSLHGAIVAAAYGVPFAYFDVGQLDLPFKWRDFSASVGIPTLFISNLAQGRKAYNELIKPALRLPLLTPILDVCPLEVQPHIRLAAMVRDGVISEAEAAPAISALARQAAGRVWTPPTPQAEYQRGLNALQGSLDESRSALAAGEAARATLEAEIVSLRRSLEDANAAKAAEAAKAEGLGARLLAADAVAVELRQQVEVASTRLLELSAAASTERYRLEQALEAQGELATVLSQQFEVERERLQTSEAAEAELRQEVASLTDAVRNLEALLFVPTVPQPVPETTVSTAIEAAAAAASVEPEPAPSAEPMESLEDRPHHDWPVALNPAADRNELGLYDRRPDDSVPIEGQRGAIFLERFALLNKKSSDFKGAVGYLNDLERPEPTASPTVSVIIPVYGQLNYTLNCLDSLLTHKSRHSFEVIVSDDASPDKSEKYLRRIQGITYVKRAENGGFIRNCNDAAAASRGEYIVMLNNDTRVVEGWLDELIGSFDIFPKAGLVGSKLFYPDGSLQEAGGIIWRDGSAWNYGRNDDPNRPRYSYARQADYISGASIAMRRKDWDALGGFDTEYVPAYAEDSDLAFRVRAAGMGVWMQALSRVIHYEGKTSGTSVTSGAKAYQVVNQRKLAKRWRGVLAGHRPNGEDAWLERDRANQKRVLVLDIVTPTPNQDAGSVTTVKVIRSFQEMGYKVVFAPVDNMLFLDPATQDLQRMGVECLYLPFDSLERHLQQFGTDYDVVHVFRPSVMKRVNDLLKAYCPRSYIIYNNMDLHYLRVARQAVIEKSETLAEKARSQKADEFHTMTFADVVCVPSTKEKEILQRNALSRPVIVMPFMVDLTPTASGFAERKDVVFVGGYSHTPNVDAAVWLAEEIWPLIEQQCPEARLILAGSKPPKAVLNLASERVIVTGFVEDLAPVFETAKVSVAPLRFGAGVKGKIYSSMSYGVPVVTTTLGGEGMGIVDRELAMVADTPEEIAHRTVELFSDQALWQRLARAGIDFIDFNHTLKAGVRAMEEAVELASHMGRRY